MVSARLSLPRLSTALESSATDADAETYVNHQRTRAPRDQDGRARVASRLQLPVESIAAAVSECARARARPARDSYPQRAANRRELHAASRRVHEADPNALDSQGPAAGRGARRAARDAIERAADELRDYLGTDSQGDRQTARRDLQKFRPNC